MADNQAVFKYSDFIKDDGAFDKAEKDLDTLEQKVIQTAKRLKGELEVINRNDLQQFEKLKNEILQVSKANDQLQRCGSGNS